MSVVGSVPPELADDLTNNTLADKEFLNQFSFYIRIFARLPLKQGFQHIKRCIIMNTFGKKLSECRKAKNLSQKELAEIFETSHTTIGKYERDEMTPSIDAAKKLAKILDTTVGYLLGEEQQADLFKDPAMLKRFQDITILPEKEKECLLLTIDNFIKAAKINLL